MKTLILTFKAPNRPLSINEANSLHWAAKRRRLEPWRDLTFYALKHADKDEKELFNNKAIRVSIKLPFSRKSRRDPHNYTSTVCKAIIDELVLGGLIPDDNPNWLSFDEPLLVVDKSLIVEIHINAR